MRRSCTAALGRGPGSRGVKLGCQPARRAGHRPEAEAVLRIFPHSFAAATDVTAEGTKSTFPTGSLFLRRLVDDGVRARMGKTFRAIIGSDTFHVVRVVDGDRDRHQLVRLFGPTSRLGLMVSSRVPAKTRTAQKVLVTVRTARATDHGRLCGTRWESASTILTRPPAKGKRIVTLSLLVGSPVRTARDRSSSKKLHPKIS